MTHRAAIIGTGSIAAAHAASLARLRARVELVAAADIDRDRVDAFCTRHGIPHAYTDAAAMLETHRPDMAIICTPPATHCDIILQCLEAGAWVLCEKPLCASLAQMDRIEEAERRTGLYVSSVFQRRFGPGVGHLRRLIAENALGRSLLCICQTTWFRDAAYYAAPWRGRWDTEMGGTTMMHGIHQIDMALWLLGEWREVSALMGTLDHEIEVEDAAIACARMENGAMLSVVNSAVSPRQETYMRIDFQKATVELRYLYDFTAEDWVYTPAPGQSALSLPSADEETLPMFAAQIAAFLDSMDRGERPPVSGADVRRTLEFITALYKAALTGQRVARGSIGKEDPFYHAMNGASCGGM